MNKSNDSKLFVITSGQRRFNHGDTQLTENAQSAELTEKPYRSPAGTERALPGQAGEADDGEAVIRTGTLGNQKDEDLIGMILGNRRC